MKNKKEVTNRRRRFTHPDNHVSILSTCRDEIVHDFSGAAYFRETLGRVLGALRVFIYLPPTEHKSVE